MIGFIQFADGKAPLVDPYDSTLFATLKRYYLKAEDGPDDLFTAYPRDERATGYRAIKDALTDLAIEWQGAFCERVYYWSDIADWSGFFARYGTRYGLMREFHENGIC